MKLFSQAWLAVVLLPVGIGVAIAGLYLPGLGVRLGLQTAALVVLGVGVANLQHLTSGLAKDA